MNAPHYPSAFPICDIAQNTATGEVTVRQYIEGGMTLRDYFAAKALSGLCVNGDGFDLKKLAEYSYEVADAMLKARQS